MDEQVFMMYTVFIGMLVFTGIAITMFVVYKILNRFSNFGDSSCKLDDYSPRAIHYLRDMDDVPSTEKRLLFSAYGENPYDGRQHTIPEQLLKNSKMDEPDQEME